MRTAPDIARYIVSDGTLVLADELRNLGQDYLRIEEENRYLRAFTLDMARHLRLRRRDRAAFVRWMERTA